MGNTAGSSLKRSHSQECLDAALVDAAMARTTGTGTGTGTGNGTGTTRRSSQRGPRKSKRNSSTRTGTGTIPTEATSSSMGNSRGIPRDLLLLMMDDVSHRRILNEFSQRDLMADYSSASNCSNGTQATTGTSASASMTRRLSSQDFANSISQMNPQDVLRQLEDIASDGMEGADEYLHSLKQLGQT
ncbi:expressed unknown protein [Seminavis robusta]|uniref:Uncharacterized protein n=1 Tax=Seminavis robusta TaxID=568900 RepID=A0A9N8DR94_9STRA|nr:expressed unknown protein [Seminavis robusta]|eukprot:Sro226_g091940.1 n/a (187) ;mRNA; f:9084-9644